MTHAQWQAKLRQSLAMVEHEPARALQSLERLLSHLQSDTKKTVGDWHVEQTLETISIVQSHLEDHRHSAETMLRVADLHEQQLSYYRRAYVTACATAALELASAGKRSGALRVLRRAEPVAASLDPQEKLFSKAQKVVAAMPHRRVTTSKPPTTAG
jgi:hypothetical protein